MTKEELNKLIEDVVMDVLDEEEEIEENHPKNTTTYHSKDTGRFTSRKKAGSVSYGHYGSNPEAGKMAVKGGSPKITKHKCGAVGTSKGKGGIGKNKYVCSTGEKITESPINGIVARYQALQTKLQRQKAEVAKTERLIDEMEAKLLLMKESQSQEIRALRIAGLDAPTIASFLNNKQNK